MISFRDCVELSSVKWERYDVISFDLFDTLIHRLTSAPDFVFNILGEKAKIKGLISKDLSIKEFKDIRLRMASAARMYREKNYGDREVTINEIWKFGPEYWDCQKLSELEVEVECSCTFLNPYVYSLLEFLIAIDKEVIILSDTYYNALQLKVILDSCGFSYFDKVRILSSCQYRLNKHSGTIFPFVKKNFILNNKNFIHIGDNYDADYLQVLKSDLEALHVKSLNYDTDQLSKSNLLSYSHFNNPYAPFPKITKMRFAEKSISFNLGVEILSPILISFSIYILEKCKEKGIKKILNNCSK